MNKNEDNTGAKQVRITPSGKIKSYVAFALDFFEKFDSRPLVLHTLPHHPPGKVTNDLKSTTLVIPRLISIVEIIKREYIKALHEKHSPRLVGLHQYNQLGTLENLGYEDNDETPENRAKQIAFALEGQNHIKLKQTPFLRVTLSLEKVPELEQSSTYQPPKMRTLSKSAKARAKKRERKSRVVSGDTALP